MHVTHPAEPTIASILAPLTVETFAEKHLGISWCRFADSKDERLTDWLDWPRLDDMLSSMRIDARRVALFKNGAALPASSYLTATTGLGDSHIAPHALDRELRDGASLMIGAVDEWLPAIGLLARELESWLHASVSANLYLSFRSTPGFKLHWDDHDTLILQLAGRKRWTIYRSTLESPLKDLGPATPHPTARDFVWQGIVEAGMRLYLPRGWWHLVEPVGELTAHVTVAWNQPDGFAVLRALRDTLASEPAVRRAMPCASGSEEVASYLARLQDAIARAVQPDQVMRALRNRDARRWQRDRVALSRSGRNE